VIKYSHIDITHCTARTVPRFAQIAPTGWPVAGIARAPAEAMGADGNVFRKPGKQSR
jgi:hypothetical protein